VMVNLRGKSSIRIQPEIGNALSEEAVAFCPACKALQTVWLNDNRLMPTRKFRQIGNRVYHDCGSNQPCRLYLT
jgi:hypothetical protein